MYLKQDKSTHQLSFLKVLFVWLFLLWGGNSSIWAQQNIHDSITYLPLIQKIDSLFDYTDIEVDNEGNIFLLNPIKNKICKFFQESKYDSVYCIGGKGSRSEGFLNLTKIVSKNRQSLYALDYGKRKIVSFNTNLKLINALDFMTINAELQPENESELFPLSFDVSEWGDLYLLNYTDNKIYKYNASGFSGITFGGTDFGQGNLKEPVSIAISPKNQVFVSDTTNQTLSIYDIYGVFYDVIECRKKNWIHWKNFILFADDLVLFNNTNAILIHLPTNIVRQINFQIPEKESINDIYINGERVFILTQQALYIFKI